MERGWYEEDSGAAAVDFLIGMEWTALWRLIARPWVSWWFLKMVRCEPAVGLERTRLALRARGPVVMQRWQSRERLDAWARDARQPHAPSWARFRRSAGGTADWGIWHEIRAAADERPSRPAASSSAADHAGAAVPAQTA